MSLRLNAATHNAERHEQLVVFKDHRRIDQWTGAGPSSRSFRALESSENDYRDSAATNPPGIAGDTGIILQTVERNLPSRPMALLCEIPSPPSFQSATGYSPGSMFLSRNLNQCSLTLDGSAFDLGDTELLP